MKNFLATNAKQLDLCLKMLFAEGIEPAVKTLRNGKGKIYYNIGVSIDEADCYVYYALRRLQTR